MRLYLTITVTILGMLLASPLYAQAPTLDDQVNRIARTLYCPVCPNIPLDVCNTQACIDWRNDIKRMLLEGKSEQEIRNYFVARYGAQVLGAPPAEGFNWLAYLLPVVGLVAGTVILWFSVRTWLVPHQVQAAPEVAPEIPREYAERLERELKEW